MEKPWTKFYDPKMTETVNCPERSIYEMLLRTARVFPERIAVSFEGTRICFRDLLEQVDAVALALGEQGVKSGEVLTVCLPNIPQAVVIVYAANKIGAILSMVHPKTPPTELAELLTTGSSRFIIILDAFMAASVERFRELNIEKVFVASIGYYLPKIKRAGFFLTKGRKIARVPDEPRYVLWKDIMDSGNRLRKADAGNAEEFISPIQAHDPAFYLHSGGTTGSPKTIVLSSHNMNYLATIGPQIVGIDDPFEAGVLPQLSMVAILPLFHGFGLCMSLHTMMCNGITAILVPLFTPDSLAKVILREKPNYIAAVPTLFEGMMKTKLLRDAKLPNIKACFCGGDSLSPDLKARFEKFLKDRGAPIALREGYGLTETVTVCCVNPEYKSREGSVGLPIPDILMKIVETGTHSEMPIGGQGEICVSGPTVMLGYLNDPDGTDEAIHTHADGIKWVHTGDFGYRDADGYFFFTQRLKRIIKVSGIPVFPSQIEAVICDIDGVDSACAIAIADPYRMHVVKAIVVLDETGRSKGHEAMRDIIMKGCSDRMIAYARPVEIEFRDDLPKTLVGKIDYVRLEREEIEKRAAALS